MGNINARLFSHLRMSVREIALYCIDGDSERSFSISISNTVGNIVIEGLNVKAIRLVDTKRSLYIYSNSYRPIPYYPWQETPHISFEFWHFTANELSSAMRPKRSVYTPRLPEPLIGSADHFDTSKHRSEQSFGSGYGSPNPYPRSCFTDDLRHVLN